MAYPFVQAMRLGDFIKCACDDWDCTVHDRVKDKPSKYLLRVVPEGRKSGELALKPGRYLVALPHADMQQRLTHEMMISLCARLGIPPGAFGFVAHKPPED